MSKFDTLAEMPVRQFSAQGGARAAVSRAFAAEVLDTVAKRSGMLGEVVRVIWPERKRSMAAEEAVKRLPEHFRLLLRPIAHEYELDSDQAIEAMLEPLQRVALFLDHEPGRSPDDSDISAVESLIRSGRGHMFLG